MGKGQLLFKGEKAKKRKKKSKHDKQGDSDVTTEEVSRTPVAAQTIAVGKEGASSAVMPAPETPAAPIMKKGTGMITTSGTVVTGHETKFEKELNPGDAILCQLENGKEELRVITMRLSNVSLNLSSAFSSNLKVPTSFHYIRKPRNAKQERDEAQKKRAETLKEQKTHAFDLYANESLVYREKTETGSYRIKRENIDAPRTREDLLEMRAKKTSDKYC